jgi:hypothetical protein
MVMGEADSRHTFAIIYDPHAGSRPELGEHDFDATKSWEAKAMKESGRHVTKLRSEQNYEL